MDSPYAAYDKPLIWQAPWVPDARPCVFCNRPMAAAGGRTREHAFPSWLLGLLTQGNDARVVHTVTGGKGMPVKRSWTSRRLDGAVKRVCAECNNGWMSELEESVARFLPTMVRGNERTYYDDGQRRLAAWATKTALMLELANPDFERRRPLEDAFFHAMERTRTEPPTRTQVWVGAAAHGGGLWHWSKD